MRAPWGSKGPYFDGSLYSVFNNLGDLKLTLASKHRILSRSSWNFALRQN